jgi:uncharacterized FAD-dependent dehydrogenase
MDGMYLIGDGSGITRGLSQSGAMGLYVADRIFGIDASRTIEDTKCDIYKKLEEMLKRVSE